MAGNRARFEELLQKANDLVWAEKWPDAVANFRKALQEFPEDVRALMGYAWSLLNAGEQEEALQIYQRLARLTPNDPGPYERIGEILEQRNENDGAAQMYMRAADIYRAQKLQKKMLTAMESTVRVNPYIDRGWAELLKHYQDQGEVEPAVQATLWLAHLYHEKHPQWAIEVCRQTQRLTPGDRRLGQVMTLLQSGRRIPPPNEIAEENPFQIDDSFFETEEDVSSEQGSPMEITRQRALEELAESIFSDERPTARGMTEAEVSMLIGKAVDAQTRGDLIESIEAYERLVRAGVSMSSIHFNLGLLYKEQMRFTDAIAQFQHSLPDAEYVLGSRFALGECYQAKGSFGEALQNFLEVVKIVDLTTVQREQADDLIRVYEGLAQNLVNTGEPERVQQLMQTLVEFLSQRGWEEEVLKARERLDGLARSGTVLSLAEIISLPGSEDILRSVALAQEYVRRKKVYSALEELFHAIGLAPYYLPLHHLLGSIFLEAGNFDAALDKYKVIARAYENRDQMSLALATYQQVLEISPLDVNMRSRVIQLLKQRGQIDTALDNLLQMADAYYQLAQPDRARDTYVDALNLSPRGATEHNWAVRILHRMADLDMQRLDWGVAIKDYEQITKVAPDDERAHLGLLRLYPRVGKAHLGMGALDRLIRQHLENKRVEKAITILEELVQEEPESTPLRARVAQLYLNLGRREKALEHLDMLGDLQLDAGHKEAAAKTLEAILALNPPNASDYAGLYKELTGREPPVMGKSAPAAATE